MTNEYAHLWDLDPDTIYLNHGSFGPSPTEVRAVREDWTARLERQPMRFFCQQMEVELEKAATELAKFLHTKPARFALIDNATVAMNVVAASVELQPGDEVILTDHEYGAVRNIWKNKCQQAGAKLVTVTLPFPINDDGIAAAVEGAITNRTAVVVFSHVTSPTAAILPVKKICEVARQRGVLSVVDGPHAIAMLDVDLNNVNCDFYCGSCHKWLCAPFGSGFLYAHPRHHANIRCPIVSWGGSIAGRPTCWQDRINWLGTRDPAPLLSIPAAINFLKQHQLKTFRSHAHALICRARSKLLEIDGAGPLCTPNENQFVSMCAIELPKPADWKPGYHGHPDPLQIELRKNHGIETPVASWNGRRFLRVSAHLYNSKDQIDKLVKAVEASRQLR